MIWIAIRMLTGDSVKFYGLVFGVAFSTLLIGQQVTLFFNLLQRAASPVYEVASADIWVMDPKAQQVEGTLPLPDTDLYRVRGVPGVAWAVPLIREGAAVRTAEGNLERITLVGVDDSTLIGLPREMMIGEFSDLAGPDAIFIDDVGVKKLFGSAENAIGKRLELNDKRAVVRGVIDSVPSFTSQVTIYTRYSNALGYVPGTRNRMTFILARAEPDRTAAEVAREIEAKTGLKARTQAEFAGDSIAFIAANTGIPINFGITVVLGFVVGIAIVGLTFSLFIRDSLKQFGALKAIGVTNGRIRMMVVAQSTLVAVSGFGLGILLAAGFIWWGGTSVDFFKGFYMPWWVVAGTAVAITLMVFGTGYLSLRSVLKLEPAEVFR